ncbi:MAG: hypothetical protein NZ961_05745 [Candidatus Poribacteria bacterium]|nr:hypothetical protein [Candidatus Poribacteria bacterium]
MAKSKYWESLCVDYVCNTIKDENLIADVETYLRNHPDVRNEIDALKKTLTTTDPIGQINLPDKILDDLEIKVYKRLASDESSQKLSVFPYIADTVSARTLWIQGGLLAVTLLVLGLALTPFFVNPIRSKDSISGVSTAPPSIFLTTQQKRMEQYRQQEIQRHFEEAIEAKHLRNDNWSTTSQFRLLRENAKGTGWAEIIDQQIQVAQASFNKGF